MSTKETLDTVQTQLKSKEAALVAAEASLQTSNEQLEVLKPVKEEKEALDSKACFV